MEDNQNGKKAGFGLAELRICQFPFNVNSSSAKSYSACPALARHSLCLQLSNSYQDWGRGYLKYLYSVCAITLHCLVKDGFAEAGSLPELSRSSFRKVRIYPRVQKLKNRVEELLVVITCGQRKLFAFLWADIQGQFEMTSLKEETTEEHLEILKWK